MDDQGVSNSRSAIIAMCFTGVAGILMVTPMVISLQTALSDCDDAEKDFAYLGTTCNITDISHTPIDNMHTLCKDGTENEGYGCGMGNDETEFSGCEDKYTIYFTAEEDNHSAVHSSVTRQSIRDKDVACDETDPLKPEYVLGYKPGRNGFVDCWKPSPGLDTSIYLDHCGYQTADCPLLKYECGDNSCYKIVDPGQRCKNWLREINEGLHVTIIVSAIFVCVFFFSCLSIIKQKIKSSKERSQRKSKDSVTVEMVEEMDEEMDEEETDGYGNC